MLAGDHLKAASDLGVPLVAIGLFYRHGYFRQSLSVDGWQQERFPDLDPHAMALELCDGVRIQVELDGQVLEAQVWRADVGRTALYLLDADLPENPEPLQLVTDRLYGGDVEHRLRQEILLGIGGVRALDALGVDVEVFHTNEGHAGFLGLERIRRRMELDGLGFDEALEAVRAGAVFTTHTPVPAGIDRFPRELIERYFGHWAEACGISIERLMELGHRPHEAPDELFNMAVMGMRLAERRNGVSRLHGQVSREMFSDLWPDVPDTETPVGSITNGVHATDLDLRRDGRPVDLRRRRRLAVGGRGRLVGGPRARTTQRSGRPTARREPAWWTTCANDSATTDSPRAARPPNSPGWTMRSTPRR